MNKTILIIAAIALSFGLIGCSKEQASDDQLEGQRQIAKANSEFNAKAYKAANPRFTADFSIVGRSDDFQSKDCPQGDGWAELSIMKVEGKVVDKTTLLCSTYSSSVGCYRKEDFDKISHLSSSNNTCNKNIPYPIKPLIQ